MKSDIFLKNLTLKINIICIALTIAKEGMPGPVFIELPIDTLYPYENTAAEVIGDTSGGGKGLVQKFVDFYMGAHMHNLFSKGFENEDYHVNVPPLAVNDADVKAVQGLLTAAKKPVILLQSQVL